jgi:hypothetical protein
MLRQLKREKLYLSNVIDGLEVIMEVRPLSTQEIEQKKKINAHMACLLREEELKWYQISI